MNIKRNIVFALEKRKKDGKPIVENVPIRMRVIYNHNRIEFTTGYRIDANKWDEGKQRVKNGCTNKLKQSASEINTDLLKYYANIQDIFKEFEVIDVAPTTEQLKAAFSNRVKKNILLEPKSEEPTISFWDGIYSMSLFESAVYKTTGQMQLMRNLLQQENIWRISI